MSFAGLRVLALESRRAELVEQLVARCLSLRGDFDRNRQHRGLETRIRRVGRRRRPAKWGLQWGLRGRVWFLGAILFLEGLALMLFSQQTVLPIAIATLILFSLCVQMSKGATYSVVPFVNKKALGAVAGIVGAGGNAGAVAAGFFFRSENLTWPTALLILGGVVAVCSSLAFAVRFSEADERAVEEETRKRLDALTPEPAAAYAEITEAA